MAYYVFKNGEILSLTISKNIKQFPSHLIKDILVKNHIVFQFTPVIKKITVDVIRSARKKVTKQNVVVTKAMRWVMMARHAQRVRYLIASDDYSTNDYL